MSYKVSGVATHDCRVIVINKSDYSIESNTLVSGTVGSGGYFAYEVTGLTDTEKLVIGRRHTDGWVQGDTTNQLTLEAPTKAVISSPTNGAENQLTGVDITWSDGGGATSYDVYFGTDSTPDASEFKGNQPGTTYEPGTLPEGVTHYWRIDAVNDGGTTTGDVWSFTVGTSPVKATSPNPTHTASDQDVDVNISWSDGGGATSYDVYFGTDPTPDASEFKGNQPGTSYEPGTLPNDTTHYWRIDSKNTIGTTTGDIWNFTTEAVAAGDRGIFAQGVDGTGGTTAPVYSNVIEYITISTTGNATDFGDVISSRRFGGAACSNGLNDRGILAGGMYNGTPAARYNIIDYITISTPGNSTDFGDLLDQILYFSSCSNNTNNRGIFAGGQNVGTELNVIEYITISSTGNSTDFGDLPALTDGPAATSNGVNNRGIIAGGSRTPSYSKVNTIDYITITSTGNSTNFGDLTDVATKFTACSNNTNNRGIMAGYGEATFNIIEYITISSTGDGTDFGDLSVARGNLVSASNGTNDRGTFAGGSWGSRFNTIDYITITSTGNASDFGDLAMAKDDLCGTSNG